jgi:hypothetical protein
MQGRWEGGDGAVHAPRLLSLCAAAALAAGMVATTARADGDPASDYLLSQQVFFPVDYFNVPTASKARFSAVVSQANRNGYKIRVALIKSAYDMGSVSALYLKPRQYAKFLSLELSFVYHQRLLIVMPNGFGFHWPRHGAAPAYRLLSRLPIQKGDTGLLQSAQNAVQRLAATAGVKVAAPAHVATPGQRNSHDRLVIIVLAVAAVFAIATTRFLLRRRGLL